MSIFGNGQPQTSFARTGDLVYLLYKNKIKMNSSLTVGENQIGYVMVNDKVTDEFLPGSYTMSIAILPISTRALRLQKKLNNAKSIIKNITADLYVISKEQISCPSLTSYKFVLKDKEFGRVETSLDFSCELKVVNGLDFLTSLRRFVAVVSRGQSAKLLKDFAREFISEIVQKKNFQLKNFINEKEKIEELIFEKFVEKMQNIGIEVISFSVDKINLKRKLLEAFGASINLESLQENPQPEHHNLPEGGQVVLERVGMQGEGDRSVEATVIEMGEQKEKSEVLSLDSLSGQTSSPKREFRINLGDNSVLTPSGIESTETPANDTQLTSNRDNIFERRRENRQGEDRENRNLFSTFNREREENVLSPQKDQQDLSRQPFFRNERVENLNNLSKTYCKKCGKMLSSDDEFCSRCGTKVEK